MWPESRFATDCQGRRPCSPSAAGGGERAWRLGPWTGALLWLLALCVCAQWPGMARAQQMHASLAAHLRFLQLGIDSGRLVATSTHPGRNINDEQRRDEVRERLSVNLLSGLPAVHYEFSSPHEQIILDIQEGSTFLLQREPRSNGGQPRVRFHQPHSGALELSVEDAGNPQSRTATSLWHLWLSEPMLCREHLLPLLQLLRPGWPLAQQAKAVEEHLLRQAASLDATERPGWEQLVGDLAHEKFSRRESAHRKLKGLGFRVLPYLLSLDRESLDDEQRFRVDQLTGVLSATVSNGAPPQVAAWLASDPRIWLALLSRDEVTTRGLAARQLADALGRAIEFSPEADEATRQAQVVELSRLPELAPPVANVQDEAALDAEN